MRQFSIFGPSELKPHPVHAEKTLEKFDKEREFLKERYDRLKVCGYDVDPEEEEEEEEARTISIQLQSAILKIIGNHIGDGEYFNNETMMREAERRTKKRCGQDTLCFEIAYVRGEYRGYLKGERAGYWKGIKESNENLFTVIKSNFFDTKSMINKISILLNNINAEKIGELNEPDRASIKKYFREIAKKF